MSCGVLVIYGSCSSKIPIKVVRDRQFLTLLTCKRVSRLNGVHFFDRERQFPQLQARFGHLNVQKLPESFAPQLHALFEHLNFQKCSEAEVLRAV